MHVAKGMFVQSSIVFMTGVRKGYSLDKWFESSDNIKDLTQMDGLWKKGNQIVVPNIETLRRRCIALHHDAPYAGHIGQFRTLEQIKKHLWWPRMSHDVQDYVSKWTCAKEIRLLIKSLLAYYSFCKSQMDYGKASLWI